MTKLFNKFNKFNKFVAVFVKSFLLFCFLFYLFINFIVVVHSLWLFFRAVFPNCLTVRLLAIFLKLLRKLRPLCLFLTDVLLLPFGCYSSFIFSFHYNIKWELRPWYSLTFSIKSSTIGKSYSFWCV